MSGNTFGTLFTLTTCGESHGPALAGIIDGCPPGIELSESDLQIELDRRKPGQSKFTTQRREEDQVRIISGVFEGRTTGTPIGVVIENTDQRSKDYSDIKDLFRPAHADYSYQQKYGTRDYRGGGRSSARETAIRVAGGAIAKKVLAQVGIKIQGYISQMGDIVIEAKDLSAINENAFFCPDPARVPELESLIESLRKEGDSVGAKVTVIADGVPPGWGEPVFDRLDADIAKAMMSINAVKAVSLGAGFDSVAQKGSEHRDEISPEGFHSNNAGGCLGGISSGQQIKTDIALKPTSSIRIPGKSVDRHGEVAEVVTKGRHDPCVGIRAVPIAESMLALVLVDHMLRQRGQMGEFDSGTPLIPAQKP